MIYGTPNTSPPCTWRCRTSRIYPRNDNAATSLWLLKACNVVNRYTLPWALRVGNCSNHPWLFLLYFVLLAHKARLNITFNVISHMWSIVSTLCQCFCPNASILLTLGCTAYFESWHSFIILHLRSRHLVTNNWSPFMKSKSPLCKNHRVFPSRALEIKFLSKGSCSSTCLI